MEWKTPIAEEARSRGLSPWDVEAELLGSGRGWRRRSSTWSAPTASRRPSTRAASWRRARSGWQARRSSCCRRSASAPEKDLRRLQELVARFAERDRRLRVASTLAENTARVLNALRPRRFPDSRDGPGHLQAAQPGAVPAVAVSGAVRAPWPPAPRRTPARRSGRPCSRCRASSRRSLQPRRPGAAPPAP